MLLAELVATSRRVSESSSRLAKIELLAERLRKLGSEEIELGVLYLCGSTRQRKLGIGYAAIREQMPNAAASAGVLTLTDVDHQLFEIAAAAGAGSAAERRRLLANLFARATPDERDFLARLLLGEVRQGALEGVMLDAIAKAAALPHAQVRRAAMLAGGLAAVARAALTEGAAGLARFSLQLFQPVSPMLAQPAEDIVEALGQLGAAAFEWKLDGARVQVHKSGDDVRIYTRALNEVTAAAPEVADALRRLPVRELILDGETIALKRDSSPHPFQITMRRFGRRLDVERMRGELPLAVFFFDCLRLDGQDLIDSPARQRFEALSRTLPSDVVMPRMVTGERAEADAFFEAALARGHEGVMAKSLDAPYEAGSRGAGWLKVKRAQTLDLIVLAAEWGSGRRQGWLSNLHLGARDPASGGFVMLGKTFKGMTDEMLTWQTQALLEREVSRDAWTVYVRPELVVEIAFNELQASPHYPGGLALRFARVKRYRPDKRVEEADTIETVRGIFERSVGAGMGTRGS
jgi:DNA ligase-1